MNRLTTMTLGALCIGFAGFVYDSASAQTPAAKPAKAVACPAYPISIYFEKDSPAVNQQSKELVDRLAREAKACGASQIVAQLSADDGRAAAITTAFKPHGVTVIVKPPAAAPIGAAMVDRTATLRVASRVG